MSDERTEAPTPRKLQQLRSEGRVVKSVDLSSAVGVLAGVVVIQQFGGEVVGQLRRFIEQRLNEVVLFTPAGGRPDLTDAGLAELGWAALWMFLGVMMPFLTIPLVIGVAVNVAQVGFLLSGKGLMPDLSRVNPMAGFKRLFSVRSVVELAKTFIKLGVLGFILYRTYLDSVPTLLALATIDLRAAGPLFVESITTLGMTVGVTYLALAALDYGYQRWEFRRDARMTKQEIKEEYKQSEGSPQIKAEMRRRARKLAMNRMMKEVPTADVVITNPTHFAVALSYRSGEMGAPKVVAKGADLVAQRIKKLARDSGVPVVENKPLARALYQAVEVDTEIPIDLFQAVAEVLAYIYALRRRRQ